MLYSQHLLLQQPLWPHETQERNPQAQCPYGAPSGVTRSLRQSAVEHVLTGGSRPGQARTRGSAGHLIRVSPSSCCAWCASFGCGGSVWAIRRGSAPARAAHGAPPSGAVGRVGDSTGFSPSSCCAWCASFGCGGSGGRFDGVQPQLVLRMVRLLRVRWVGWAIRRGSAPARAAHGAPPSGAVGRVGDSTGFSPSSCCAWCASFGCGGSGGRFDGVQPQLVLRMVRLLRVRWVGWAIRRGSAPARAAHGAPPSGAVGRVGDSTGFSPSSCCAWCASFGCGGSGGRFDGAQPQLVLRMVRLLRVRSVGWAIRRGSAPARAAHGAPPSGAVGRVGDSTGLSPSSCCAWCASFGCGRSGGRFDGAQPQLVLRIAGLLRSCGRAGGLRRVSPSWCWASMAS